MTRILTNINNKYYGFGILEVMLASLLVSAGVIGMASLQNRALAQMVSSFHTNTAAYYAKEMSSRIQLLPSVSRKGYKDSTDYLTFFASDPIDTSYSGNVETWYASIPSSSNCYMTPYATACTATQMALSEKAEIARAVSELLPEGRIKVCFDSTNSTNFNCDNRRSAADGSPNARVSSYNNTFTVKIRWRNSITHTYEYYELKFTAACTDTTGCGAP